MGKLFFEGTAYQGVIDKFKSLEPPAPPLDSYSSDEYKTYLRSYDDYVKLAHSVVIALASAGAENGNSGSSTVPRNFISAKQYPNPLAHRSKVEPQFQFDTGSEESVPEVDEVVAVAKMSARRQRAARRAAAFGATRSGAKSLSRTLPQGLCYAILFKGHAQEAVAMDLAFWPTFRQVLLQPSDAAFPVYLWKGLHVVKVDDGRFHVTAKKSSESVPIIDVFQYLARSVHFTIGTLGDALSRHRTYLMREDPLPFDISLDHKVGGEEGSFATDLSEQFLLDVGTRGYVKHEDLTGCSGVYRTQVCDGGDGDRSYDFKIKFASVRNVVSGSGNLRSGDAVVVSCPSLRTEHKSVVSSDGTFRFYGSKSSSGMFGYTLARLRFSPFNPSEVRKTGHAGFIGIELAGTRFRNRSVSPRP